MKNKILKRAGFWLFMTSFVLNVVFTTYAAGSHMQSYHTGSDIIGAIGAFVSGGGPFIALVGAACLAAGIVYELESEDPVDNLLEDFIHNGVITESQFYDRLSYVFDNITVDSDGNIDYRQVEDNINAYVEACGIMISSGKPVSFLNDVLYVAPEVIASMAQDIRAWVTGSSYQGTMTYPVTFDLASGFVFPSGSEADVLMSSILANGGCYVVDNTYNDYGYISVYYSKDKKLGAGLRNYYGDSSCALNQGVSSQSPYATLRKFNADGSPAQGDNSSSSSYVFGNRLLNILYYGGGFGFAGSLLSALGIRSLPVSNDYPVDGLKNPVRDLYGGLDVDALDLPADIPVGADGTIAIDKGMLDDLEKAYEKVIGIADGAMDRDISDEELKKVVSDTIASTLDDVLSNAQDREKPSVPSVPPSGLPELEGLKTDGLIDKFPFCVPFDLISLVKAFEAEAEAPYIEIPFVVPVLGSKSSIVIDFSKFEYVAAILRSLEVVGFTLFLVLKTRELIKG